MRPQRRLILLAATATAAVVIVAALLSSSAAEDAAPATRPSAAVAADDMAVAARRLWDALTPEQQKSAGFEFKDDERLNFHFVPRPRKGLHWGQMTPTQRLLAHALLSTGLSRRTFVETTTVMSLEEILAGSERGRGPNRDPDLYYFTIFGTPGSEGAWGWRVEGHHVSLNFTIVHGRGIAGAPAFLGANPAEVRDGPRKGLRTLAAEQDMGFALLHALDDEQRKVALTSDKAPADIVTRNNVKADVGEPQGIALSQLKPDQQKLLRQIVRYYAHRLRDELAEVTLNAIERAGWENVRFAWAGGDKPGAGHYYRLHGPTFLVEYDNTQGGANHIHTVWRDLKGDFGQDLLAEHYEKEHVPAKP